LDLPGFIVAECCGALAALVLMGWLLRAAGEGDAIASKAR
jgi:hypothetical protein